MAVVNFIWEMPWYRDAQNPFAKHVLGGWQLSGVTQWQTGTPFSIGRGDDYLGIGSTNGKTWNLNGIANQPKRFANRNANLNYTGVTDFWFEPTVGGQPWATRPANGTYPNQNRQSIPFHNPGFQNWNLAAFKQFKIAESQGLQFRFEAFNWPNHPNWGGVNTDPTSPTFGMVTGKSSQRELQLSLRYFF